MRKYDECPEECEACGQHLSEVTQPVAGWQCNNCFAFYEKAPAPEPILECPEAFSKQVPRLSDTYVSQTAIRAIMKELEYPPLKDVPVGPELGDRWQKQHEFFVALQGIDRRYGGPEEGGWYYDWVSTADVFRCFGMEAVLLLLKKLSEENPPPRRGRGSVLGGTDPRFYVATTSDEIVETESKRRPRYE